MQASSGGAVATGATSNTTFTRVTFHNNTAGIMGGAVMVSSGQTKMTNVNFINNTASAGAGVCAIQGSTLKMHDSRFVHNQVRSKMGIPSSGDNMYICLQLFCSGGQIPAAWKLVGDTYSLCVMLLLTAWKTHLGMASYI